jgi:two-component system, NarL family, response regulator DesR
LIGTLVAEPAALIREGLVAILSRETDIEVVAAVRRGQDVLPTARGTRPRVALVATAFPDGEGVPLAAALRAAVPECRCAILSTGGRVRDHPGIIDGYLVYDCPPEFLTDAIRQLANEKRVVDPSLTLSSSIRDSCPLTAREAEALLTAAQGASTAEIGRLLSLSEGTVRNYLSRAIAKTGARNRIDAIRIANERGWLLSP